MINKTYFIICLVALQLMAGCRPKTDIDRIDALKEQVTQDVKTLNDLNANTFIQLQKDFVSCDSSLRFLSEKEVEAAFTKLQLVDAYIQQFNKTYPVMQAEMDSSLTRLELLRTDAETHYLPDSLVASYLEDETRQVEKLNSQVEYFKDRLGACRKDLDGLKILK